MIIARKTISISLFPFEENVESCIVTEDVIDGIGEPVIGYKEKAVAGTRKKKGFKEIEETA